MPSPDYIEMDDVSAKAAADFALTRRRADTISVRLGALGGSCTPTTGDHLPPSQRTLAPLLHFRRANALAESWSNHDRFNPARQPFR